MTRSATTSSPSRPPSRPESRRSCRTTACRSTSPTRASTTTRSAWPSPTRSSTACCATRWASTGTSTPTRASSTTAPGASRTRPFPSASPRPSTAAPTRSPASTTWQTITDLVDAGLVSEERVTLAAERLLAPLFEMGLFEDPYVDPAATATVGSDGTGRRLDLQRKSTVLLQNRTRPDGGTVLPLPAGGKVYIDRHGQGRRRDATATRSSTATPRRGAARPPRPHDVAIIRGQVRNVNTCAYRNEDRRHRAQPGASTRAPASLGRRGSVRAVPGRQPGCTDDGRLVARASSRPAFRRLAPVGGEHPRLHRDGGVGVLADHAVAGRHPGGDARSRAANAPSSPSTSATRSCSTRPAA